MTNTTTLLKVFAIWITAIYIICFVGVLLFPGLRGWFMLYGLHVQPTTVVTTATWTTFFSGLVLWNVIAASAVSLYCAVWKKFA